MTDKETQVLLSTPIDQETLNKALAGLAALSTALEKVKAESQDASSGGKAAQGPSFGERIGAGANAAIGKFNDLQSKVASVGHDIDEFGGRAAKTLAKLGTGITLGIVGLGAAAARSFATDRAGVDPQANAQNRASAQVKNSFDDLGRVTSRVVTPALETLSTVIEIVAKAADQIIPKSLEGDNNPFNTFIEKMIPEAIRTVQKVIEVFIALGSVIERDFGNALDTFITGFRTGVTALQDGIGQALNGLLEIFANLAEALGNKGLGTSLRKGEDNNAIAGGLGESKTNYQRQIEQQQKELQDRIDARNAKTVATGEALGVVDDKLDKSVDTLKEAIHTVGEFTSTATTVGKAEVDAFNTRNEAIAKADEQYQENRKTDQDVTNKAIQQLTKAHDKALTQLQKEQTAAEKDLADNYNKDKLKSIQSFNDNEAQVEKENQLKREQDLRRHELTLRELASEGDVAGFITEQKQFSLDQGDAKEQQDLAKRDRQKAFNTENQDRDEQYATELAKLQASGKDKQDQLDEQFQEQKDDQKSALAEQLDQLKRAHEKEDQQIDRDFVNQLSQLDSNLGGLQSLRNQDYANQLKGLDAFIKTQQGYLQNLYQTAPGAMLNGTSGGASSGGDTYHVNVNNTVGDVATQSMLNDYQQTTVDGVAQALANSRGRSTPSVPF